MSKELDNYVKAFEIAPLTTFYKNSILVAIIATILNLLIFSMAADAIDRVELLKNNVLEEMIVHSGSWENKKIADDEVIRVKFTVEFGWGPNPRFYKDMLVKEWDGSLNVEGKLLSIDKEWNSYGQKLYDVTDDSCKFHMTTYMSDK